MIYDVSRNCKKISSLHDKKWKVYKLEFHTKIRNRSKKNIKCQFFKQMSHVLTFWIRKVEKVILLGVLKSKKEENILRLIISEKERKHFSGEIIHISN